LGSTPTYGLIEAELRASADPTCMLAFWLIGFEEEPASAGEICVAELFGHAIESSRATVNIGVKAHHDPRLHDDMETVALGTDATAWHLYSAEWTQEEVRFFVDNEPVRTVRQRIGYPLQLMLDLFEFPPSSTRDPRTYPKIGEGKGVRGFRKACGTETKMSAPDV
jgi:beta-glucanase (GH16 family)